MGSLARQIVEEHLELCLTAGINHEGINAEVAKGQWEFQIFAKGSAKAADDLWTARYLMMRLCEQYEDRYGTALQADQGRLERVGHAHAISRRSTSGKPAARNILKSLMKAFNGSTFRVPISRFTDRITICVSPVMHETQAIDKFSYGLSDRGASIRMPVNFIKDGYKGYLEDRRPNSEADPYQIVSRVLKTINTVPKP